MKTHERLSQVRPASELRDKRSFGDKARDWLLGRPAPTDPLPRRPFADPERGRVGIACSGGGVRSAAYNLGALQVLRDRGVFGLDAEGHQQGREVLVAAVSGGSYVASAFATVAAESAEPNLAPRDVGGPGDDGAHVPRRVYAPSSPEEVHLRNHSDYMAPGLGGKLRLGLRVVMGMLANFFVIGVAVGIVGAGLGILYGEGFAQLARAGAAGALHPPAAAWLVPLCLLGFGACLLVPDLFRRVNNDSKRRFLEAWATRLIALALALGVVLVAVPQLILWVRGFSLDWAVDAASTASVASTRAHGRRARDRLAAGAQRVGAAHGGGRRAARLRGPQALVLRACRGCGCRAARGLRPDSVGRQCDGSRRLQCARPPNLGRLVVRRPPRLAGGRPDPVVAAPVLSATAQLRLLRPSRRA